MKTPVDYPKLNLPPCRLKVSERGGELCVWDAVRGRWLVLTPEEWVRRHVLEMLIRVAGVAAESISQEYPVAMNGSAQRADIVVVGRDGRARMLVECKAPGVVVDEVVLAQAFRYNTVVGARYVMLTNGTDHYIYEVEREESSGSGGRVGKYTPLKEFPELDCG